MSVSNARFTYTSGWSAAVQSAMLMLCAAPATALSNVAGKAPGGMRLVRAASWSASTSAGALLTLRAVGFAPRRGGAQAVRLVVDGQPAADWTVPDGQQVLLQVALPATGHTTTLTLHIAQPTSPAARDGAADPRTLGLLLRGLRLDPG